MTVLGAAGSLAFVGLNLVSYMHAYKMTHFTIDGEKTPRPEDLSMAGKIVVLLSGVTVPKPQNLETPETKSLEYRTVVFQGRDKISNEAWIIEHSNARGTVALFHGFTGKKSDLLEEAVEFHRLGYSVLLVDFAGSGGSSGVTTTIGYHESEEVAATLQYAKDNLPPPYIIFAQSMGAAATLKSIHEGAAAPDALILECPFDRMLSTVQNRFTVMGLPGFPFAQSLVFWGGVQNNFDAFDYNPAEYAQAVKMPVLLMNGEDDDRVTLEQAENIYSQISGTKTFVSIPETGHGSYIAAQPEIWKTSVSRFLATITNDVPAIPGVN